MEEVEQTLESAPDAAQEDDLGHEQDAVPEQHEAAHPGQEQDLTEAESAELIPTLEATEEDLVIADVVSEAAPEADESVGLKAVIEAAIYITDEPLTPDQIATAVGQPLERVKAILEELVAEYSAPDSGLSIRELAGGYKMSTKAEHHESIRRFVKRLQPPLKLSLAALETLAVVAYKQPITGPEIMEIRGVQGAGVLKTLLDRKLVAGAGRKNVLGKPIMYKTTREFLIQFGLSSLAELPTLKEFEELGRLALSDSEAIVTTSTSEQQALTGEAPAQRTLLETDAEAEEVSNESPDESEHMDVKPSDA